MASKTFRRDRLKRLVEQGKVVLVSAYSFDDMHGEDRVSKEMPVQMMPDNRSECRQGICYVGEWDFNSGSGRAWKNDNGTITLYVHSNSNYTFRVKE